MDFLNKFNFKDIFFEKLKKITNKTKLTKYTKYIFYLIFFAGFPAYVPGLSIFLVTVDPAPITTLEQIFTGKIVELLPI